MNPALCTLALNFVIPPDGVVPDWIELIPAQPQGLDGRAWTLDQPDQVIAAFQQRSKPIPVDWEHATELKAPKGEPAPAAGWIEELQVRAGAVWGRIHWTERAQAQLQRLEYRFISPAFYADSQGQIQLLSSAALTNKPNFNLQLNSEEPMTHPVPELITQALGLAAEAGVEPVVAAINQLKADQALALNQAKTPDLKLFVPRADYDAALQRALNAEQKVAAVEKAALDQSVDAVIQEGLTAGKITPATKDYYLAQCRREGGLEEFKKFLQSAPALLPDANLPGKPPMATAPALNSEELQVAALFGHQAEELQKYGNRESSPWVR